MSRRFPYVGLLRAAGSLLKIVIPAIERRYQAAREIDLGVEVGRRYAIRSEARVRRDGDKSDILLEPPSARWFGKRELELRRRDDTLPDWPSTKRRDASRKEGYRWGYEGIAIAVQPDAILVEARFAREPESYGRYLVRPDLLVPEND